MDARQEGELWQALARIEDRLADGHTANRYLLGIDNTLRQVGEAMPAFWTRYEVLQRGLNWWREVQTVLLALILWRVW